MAALPFRRLALLSLLACAAAAQDVFHTPSEYSFPPGSTFPGAEWEKVASPEDVGYSSARLDVLRAWLKTQNTTSMLAVTGGRVLFEYGNVSEVSKIASVRKSILGMMFGKYIATNPKVLHASVKDLGLGDMTPFTGPEEYATLQDLLMSRSGIYFNEDKVGPRKGTVPPGAMFHYNNWDFNAAGTAFEKIAGKGIYEALETDLARPIGMQDFDKSKQKKIQTVPEKKLSVHSEYAMYLSTRDMARIGLLMARAGKWNGAQLMPRNWNEYLTTLRSPANELWPVALRWQFARGSVKWGYGVMWWVWDEPLGSSSATWSTFTGSYTGMGTDGQYITVIPALDLVIAHKNSNIDKTPSQDVSISQYQTVLMLLTGSRK